MSYPNQILPAKGNKLIDCDLTAYFIIRHTDIADENIIKDPLTGLIRPVYLCEPTARIDDLSSSLLGFFEPGFITLEFTPEGKEKYMLECSPNEAVETPVTPADYHHNTDRNCWTMQIGLVQDKSFEYTLSNTPYSATCKVMHTPMRWNYWHFSFRWDTNNLGLIENLPEKERNKVARRIGVATRSLFCNFAKLEIPEHNVLPEACYKIPVAGQAGCASLLALLLL